MARRVVAVHQPNFLPWLGWWDKLVRADVLVLLDDVQFPKGQGVKSGNWVNRVRFLIGGRPGWLTVPVERRHSGVRTIAETRIDETYRWRDKMLRTIEQSYARAPYVETVMPLIDQLIRSPAGDLAEFNETALTALAAGIGLDPAKLLRSSSLGIDRTGTERLIEIVRAVAGTAYLTGGGATEYQRDNAFALVGIELVQQSFSHPNYPQLAEAPVHGLSIVDALMSCGFDGTARLLRVNQ